MGVVWEGLLGINNISISYLLFRDFMKDFFLLGFGLAMYGFNSFELTG
jgi:hypothetical protein